MATDGFGVTFTGGTSGAVAELISCPALGLTRGKFGTTTHGTIDGDMTSVPMSTKEVPDMTLVLLYTKAQEVKFRALFNTQTPEEWTVEASDGSTWVCDGYPIDLVGDPMVVDALIQQSITFAFTGTSVFTAG